MNIWIIGLLKMNVNPDSVHIHFSFEGAGPFYKGKSDGAVYSVRSLIFLNGFSSRLLEKRERRLGHFGHSNPSYKMRANQWILLALMWQTPLYMFLLSSRMTLRYIAVEKIDTCKYSLLIVRNNSKEREVDRYLVAIREQKETFFCKKRALESENQESNATYGTCKFKMGKKLQQSKGAQVDYHNAQGRKLI